MFRTTPLYDMCIVSRITSGSKTSKQTKKKSCEFELCLLLSNRKRDIKGSCYIHELLYTQTQSFEVNALVAKVLATANITILRRSRIKLDSNLVVVYK